MLRVIFKKERDAPLRLLCLGAHSDDIEIGCGGTILRLLEDYPDLIVDWIVFGSDQRRRPEALASAEQFLANAKDKRVVAEGFRDGFFPYVGGEIKERFEELKREVNPDIIFTHCHNDGHQDHRVISELTWNTFRNHLILAYEVPKYDGDLGTPNFFVHLTERVLRRKVQMIMEHFTSQRDKHWFTEDTFLALARLRGIESNSQSRYAEAFYCRKTVL